MCLHWIQKKNHSCTADPKPQITLLTPKPELPQHAKRWKHFYGFTAVKNGSFMINNSKKRFPIMIFNYISTVYLVLQNLLHSDSKSSFLKSFVKMFTLFLSHASALNTFMHSWSETTENFVNPKTQTSTTCQGPFCIGWESRVVFFSGAVKNGSFMINDSKKRFPIMILALIFFSSPAYSHNYLWWSFFQTRHVPDVWLKALFQSLPGSGRFFLVAVLSPFILYGHSCLDIFRHGIGSDKAWKIAILWIKDALNCTPDLTGFRTNQLIHLKSLEYLESPIKNQFYFTTTSRKVN